MIVHCLNVWSNRDNLLIRHGDDSGKVSQPYEFNGLALGILGGLVAVTPCGPFIPKWAAADSCTWRMVCKVDIVQARPAGH